MRGLLARFLAIREAPAGCLLLGIFAALAVSRPEALNAADLLDLTRQYAELGMIAVGLTLVIGTGGIDISVGSTVGATSVVLGVLATRMGVNVWLAAGIALAVAAAIGAFNGWSVMRLRLQPVVVTLAAMSAARGLAYVLSGGMSMSGFPDTFTALGRLAPWNLMVPVGMLAITAVSGHLLLCSSTFGRGLLALGASEEAARLSGIAVRRIKLMVYLITGLLAGMAGVMTTARVITAVPDAGLGYEFEAITAVVMGGTKLNGGEATVIGTLLGVATMAVLRRWLNLMGATDIWKMLFLGVVLIAAVGLDIFRNWLAARVKSGETRI